ncbi:unnamed protein product [Moneuplotes crassus]|uniref:DUF7803 domain-containing protein n=1 Tax=Euplotes crassus TaxID=5936 RepID=A0AAD1Y3U3_EUPCR|nr:unnamed protein product [Moneuplotes crassus]
MSRESGSIDNPKDFQKEPMPKIPYDFPKERLPLNLCEIELADILKCVNYTGYTIQCSHYMTKYYLCKKKRDTAIFGEIQEWETEKYSKLGLQERRDYIQTIKDENDELNKKLKTAVKENQDENLQWRLSSDLKQNKWRVEYLSETQ